MQAAIFDGLSFDPFSLFDDGACPAEVGVSRRHIGQAVVIALMVVMFAESFDLGFEGAGQIVVFQQYAVLQSLVPRSILPCAWGWTGALRTWLMFLPAR